MLHRLLLLATLATHTSAQFTDRTVLHTAVKMCVGGCQTYQNVLTLINYNTDDTFPGTPEEKEAWLNDPGTVCGQGDWTTGTGTGIPLPLSGWIDFAGGARADWLTADAPAEETDACALMPYWDVSQVTDFSYLFANAHYFNVDISRWDVSAGTTFQSMFNNAYTFNVDISHWDVSAGTVFQGMFLSALSFAQNLNTWQISRTANTNLMFALFMGSNADGDAIYIETPILPALCSEAWLDNKGYIRAAGGSTWAPYGDLCCDAGHMAEEEGLSCVLCDVGEYSLGGENAQCTSAGGFTLDQLKSTDKGLQELKRAYQTANGCSS